MLITDTKIYILQDEQPQPKEITSRYRMLEKVPPALTGRHTRATMMHAQDESLVFGYSTGPNIPTFRSILRLQTDGDIDAYTSEPIASLASPAGAVGGFVQTALSLENLRWQAYWFKVHVATNLIGHDALDREAIWQKLSYGQRFNGYGRRLVDVVDNMLWDLASRHFRQPIVNLIGRRRDAVPCYYGIGGNTIDELVADAVMAKQEGWKGAKDHSYRGVKANLQLAKELRAACGPDFGLMHDCVWNYTYEDAVKVGRELERQNYAWMEEPMVDYDAFGLKKLCDTLDVPVMSREFTPACYSGQPYSESWFLANQATDMVRQRGLGITGHLKVAQLAASFGVPVHGCDYHVVMAIDNEEWFEGGACQPRPNVRRIGGPSSRRLDLDYMPTPKPDPSAVNCRGTWYFEDGYTKLVYSDKPVEEPDWDDIEKKAVEVV